MNRIAKIALAPAALLAGVAAQYSGAVPVLAVPIGGPPQFVPLDTPPIGNPPTGAFRPAPPQPASPLPPTTNPPIPSGTPTANSTPLPNNTPAPSGTPVVAKTPMPTATPTAARTPIPNSTPSAGKTPAPAPTPPLGGKRDPMRRHPKPQMPPTGMQGKLGGPLAGLNTAQLMAFESGREEFANVESVDSGLGPCFNNVSCISCHFSGASGGGSANTVTRFGRSVNGVFDALDGKGGSLLQARAIDPRCQEIVPSDANVVALRQSTPLFGLGLIEAIPDTAILANASAPLGNHPEDGIHGRAALVTDVVSGQKRVGRFGWKNQQATLLAFAGDAYLNEMGITSRFFQTENAPNGDAAKLAAYDHVADVEDTIDPATGKADIDLAADFMRYLAPPPQQPMNGSASAGQGIFYAINCAACHKPEMATGPNTVAALNNKPVRLFSDLLLHNMGDLGDGIAQGAAKTNEFRTAPLWGLRFSAPYLHDGSAATVDEAIRAHDGEAANSRDRYIQLTPAQQKQLLDYLATL